MIGSWWDEREPRERLLLLTLAAIAAVFVLIFAVVLPLQNAGDQAERDLEQAQTDLRLVQRVAPNLSTGSADRLPFDRSALVQAATNRNVRIARIQPDENGALAVWIDDAPTLPLYGLFDDILTDYAATMERASVSANGDGTLSAQFTLRPI